MTNAIKNVDEALKEIELQKMVLENLGITSKQMARREDVSFLVERVMNTCFMPSDFIIIYKLGYENQVIGSSKLYAHDTGDYAVVIDIENRLPTEVVKQLLLLGYKIEGRHSNWLTYIR